MAVDDDDLPSQVIQDERLNIKKVVLKRGATMGQLNQACFDTSNGRFVIIANDDIILRTPAWDERVSAVFALYPDDIALVHVNDLLFRERLCTFPIISRRACLEAGLTLPGYRRYKIDDHLYDIYSMLAYLGHKRIVYLPEVIFEHDNHDNALVDHANEHIFKSDDQKVYTPKKGIIEQDHELFMSTFAQRKNAAAALARLIDDTRFGAAQARQQAEAYRLHPAARTHLYRSVLGDLPDPYSYRWPDLVKTFSIAPEGWLHSPRVTVAVVTANIQHPFAAECIRRVKQYTHNYDLVILDNNRGPDFKHAREMNKILRITQSDYLVLMDDDVYVEEGWLDGLLRAMDEQTGVVVPLHTGQDGKVNFSGMYLACDDSGNHEHLVDIPAAPREAQVVCSAIMLMELRKVGRIFMDEKYSKYFFDPVYSCEVWEAGYKVMVTPEVTVAHLGGATMVRGTQEAGGLWARDGEIFTNDWVKTGRLEKLFPVWAQYPALQPLVAIPQQINTLFQSALKLSDAQFEQQLTACIDTARAYPLFQKLIALRAQQTASKLAEQGAQVKARLCQAALKFLVVNEQIDYQTSPVLVQGNYKGFNIVHFRQKYIALSIALGTIDLTHTPQEKLDGYNTAGQCFITATLEEAKAQVDALARQPQPEGILVSAIVSTYNAERFMRACLEDLEAQTLRDHLEIIVIDSGSQQNERAIVAEFKKKYPNIVYLRTERENHHLAMNRGIALARGRYVTMANTDDRHHPDAFRRMAEIMERDASIGVVYHDSAITSRENAALYSGPVSGRFRWPDFDRKLLFQICFLGPQPMWRKALHEQYGGYDAEYTTAGDYELWLRLSDKTRFYHLPQVLGLYYESPASNEHKNAGLAAAESDRARRKHWRAADGPLPPSLGPIFLERYQALPAGFPAGNFPLVSVIIPTYNRPAELRAALQSVVEQTYPNLEVIVVNDAGEDVSAVLRAFEGRRPLRCIVQPANQGAGAARNAGILAAQGKYLAFLDDDDAFHPEHLFLLAAELDQRPALAAAYSDALQAAFNIKKNEKARLAGKQVAFSQDFTVDELLARNYIPMLCLMARAEAVEEAGLFDAALPALEDWEWLIRLAQAGPFSHLPLVTAEYVVREGGSSRNMLSAGQIQELYLRIYQKHATLASRAARELQRRVYGFKTGRDLSLDAPALFAAPAAAAPSRAQETFRLLLNADDISAALQQYRNRFDAGLLALVHSNAAAARADGQAELAEGLDDLAAYIAEVVEGK
jgi:glycosyltransferase involved in cell wall biosynthesis